MTSVEMKTLSKLSDEQKNIKILNESMDKINETLANGQQAYEFIQKQTSKAEGTVNKKSQEEDLKKFKDRIDALEGVKKEIKSEILKLEKIVAAKSKKGGRRTRKMRGGFKWNVGDILKGHHLEADEAPGANDEVIEPRYYEILERYFLHDNLKYYFLRRVDQNGLPWHTSFWTGTPIPHTLQGNTGGTDSVDNAYGYHRAFQISEQAATQAGYKIFNTSGTGATHSGGKCRKKTRKKRGKGGRRTRRRKSKRKKRRTRRAGMLQSKTPGQRGLTDREIKLRKKTRLKALAKLNKTLQSRIVADREIAKSFENLRVSPVQTKDKLAETMESFHKRMSPISFSKKTTNGGKKRRTRRAGISLLNKQKTRKLRKK